MRQHTIMDMLKRKSRFFDYIRMYIHMQSRFTKQNSKVILLGLMRQQTSIQIYIFRSTAVAQTTPQTPSNCPAPISLSPRIYSYIYCLAHWKHTKLMYPPHARTLHILWAFFAQEDPRARIYILLTTQTQKETSHSPVGRARPHNGACLGKTFVIMKMFRATRYIDSACVLPPAPRDCYLTTKLNARAGASGSIKHQKHIV